MSEYDRMPLPPEVLVDALQDRVHIEIGLGRAAKSVKVIPELADKERK